MILHSSLPEFGRCGSDRRAWFKSLVLLMLALLPAFGPGPASRALAADDPQASVPASIELWIEGVPKGASNELAQPRGAWTLYVDDLQFTQSVDEPGERATTLLGPQVNDGDFESGQDGVAAWLAQSVSVVEASAAGVPAARGRKFLAMVADPAAERHFPRVVKFLGMPNLSRGQYFVLTGKVRAKEWDGITHASVSVVFINKNKAQFLAYHGERVAVTPDGWVEVKLEFDYYQGIPKKSLVNDPVTREKLAAKVAAERAQWPAYDIRPRPDDGKNLALSVAKWEGRAGIPGEPFRIWFVGASWTDALAATGYRLENAIRQRFPNARPIEFKRHSGSGTPWNYARGWISQFVLADQPDLILTYTHGDPEMLDAMLADIRRHSTADIIVPSLHLMAHEDAEPARWIEWFQGAYGFPLSAIREISKKYNAEFVENRRELAEYLTGIGKKPSALLADGVHQNTHGNLRTWDNIVRHIAKPRAFNETPESRERKVPVSPAAKTATERVVLSSDWSVADGVARTSRKGERIKVEFMGNRIDLLGRSVKGGGSIKVFIDGKPADRAPVFFTTSIRPQPKAFPWKIAMAGPGDVGPHAVDLGRNIVPQTWTITLTSETGDYRLEGSVTGADGEGNSAQPFTSRSGQIRIDPGLWRFNGQEEQGKVTYGNRAGDKYAFDVYRSAVGVVSFAANQPGRLHRPLAQNLDRARGLHVLEIETQGDGEVVIESFYVFQPPEN